MSLTPRQKLSAAIARVSDPAQGIAPYFGAILRGLVRREMPPEMCAAMAATGRHPTMAVTKDGLLFWAATFVEAQSNEDLAYALMHETMHVMTKSFERSAALGIVPEPTPEMASKAMLANLASDMCINEQLTKIRPCPKDWVYPATFKQADNLIFEERYRLLLKEVQEQHKQSGGEGEGKGKGKPQAGVGKGWCGGCAGHPVPGEPTSGKSPDGRSEAEMERFRKETAGAIKEYVQKGRGTVPDGLVRWAEEQFAPPKIDWRRKLAQTVRAAVAYKSGAVDFHWGKVSRRQAGVGFGVGRPIIPSYRAPVPSVSVVVDTSGSMSRESLVEALSEVQGILAAVGSEVTFCAIDAAVHSLQTVSTAKAAAELLKGGGGTDMRDAFIALEARKPRADVLVVITDGFLGDGYPAIEPRWCRTVWVVLSGGNPKPCPWGETVVVDEELKAA